MSDSYNKILFINRFLGARYLKIDGAFQHAGMIFTADAEVIQCWINTAR